MRIICCRSLKIYLLETTRTIPVYSTLLFLAVKWRGVLQPLRKTRRAGEWRGARMNSSFIAKALDVLADEAWFCFHRGGGGRAGAWATFRSFFVISWVTQINALDRNDDYWWALWHPQELGTPRQHMTMANGVFVPRQAFDLTYDTLQRAAQARKMGWERWWSTRMLPQDREEWTQSDVHVWYNNELLLMWRKSE